MEIQNSDMACDDGFNDFIHHRTTSKVGKTEFGVCENRVSSTCLEVPDGCESRSSKSGYASDDNTITELLRSEGSGSENGQEINKRDHTDLRWYRNEKLLGDKCNSTIASIHNSNINTKQLSVTSTGSYNNWSSKSGGKTCAMDWRDQRMESFESNKEYVGSECGDSSFSCYTPSKQQHSPEHLGEDDDWDTPRGERWPPLGAPNDDDCISSCSFEELGRSRSEVGRLRELEDEQEQLTSSLLSLTSHFAQVQFRLKQIVSAEPGEKEKLLKELEEFADRGIPDIRAIQQTRNSVQTKAGNLDEQRELIERLKQQLDELEQYAYRTGEAGLPQTTLVHKQKVIIDQLKGMLPLELEDLGELSVDDLRSQVDTCVKQLVNPLKMKEKLVDQLQTQVGDLERFIDFLQDDCKKLPVGALSPSKCKCGGHDDLCPPPSGRGQTRTKLTAPHHSNTSSTDQQKQQLQDDTAHLVNRAALLLNMLRFAQLGCGGQPNTQNCAHATTKGNHWGDVRANLEVCIATLVEQLTGAAGAGHASATQLVTLNVRKQFVPALRDLIHHGLAPTSSGRSLVSVWSCFPDRRAPTELLHAWDLVLQYYRLKRGDQYNTTPARRLSQSYNLEMSTNTAGAGGGHKCALLAAVGSILGTHTPLKRSHDSHFKAFVSEALNQGRLVVWLRLVLRCTPLVNKCYQPWSYVKQTGFDDALQSLDALQQFEFHLPVDLAVRSLRNITEAF